jgi:hypothetical protein
MSTAAEARNPAWCDPQHCFVTDEGVRVPEQAPTRGEDDTAAVRFESRLVDLAEAARPDQQPEGCRRGR